MQDLLNAEAARKSLSTLNRAAEEISQGFYELGQKILLENREWSRYQSWGALGDALLEMAEKEQGAFSKDAKGEATKWAILPSLLFGGGLTLLAFWRDWKPLYEILGIVTFIVIAIKSGKISNKSAGICPRCKLVAQKGDSTLVHETNLVPIKRCGSCSEEFAWFNGLAIPIGLLDSDFVVSNQTVKEVKQAHNISGTDGALLAGLLIGWAIAGSNDS